MSEDRDRRRQADPLHGRARAPSSPHALDDSGEINPPPVPNVSDLGGDTPLVDVLERVESRVGRLSERDREIVAVIHDYVDHGRRRSADVQAELDQRIAHVPQVDREALGKLFREDMAGWEPFKGDRERLDKLEAAEAGRTKVLGGIKRWVWASGLTALLALGAGLIDYGRRQAAGDSDRDQAAADRRALIEQTAKNHAQDIEIGVLRALVRTLERNNRRINGDD